MTFETEKWVLVARDYCCDGVWDRDDVSRGADELPVSAELVARLLAWQDVYNENESRRLQYDDDEGEGKFDLEAFSEEGLEIARAMKAELPDWTVLYFDAAKYAQSRRYPMHWNDEFFRYEITGENDDGQTGLV